MDRAEDVPESVFLVHLHHLPETIDRRHVCGLTMVVERDSRRLSSSYGWNGPDLSVEGFLRKWPSFLPRLGLDPSCTILLAVEGAGGIAAPSRLADLWEAGLRVIQPRHWADNQYISDEGLTLLGRELLYIMGELGFILDASHLSGRLLLKVLDQFEGRIIVSHGVLRDVLEGSGPRANSLTADELKVLASRNALIGIPFVNDLVARNSPDAAGSYNAGVDDVVLQIAAMAEIIGYEHLSLGPDYFDFASYSARLGLQLGTVSNLETSLGLCGLQSKLPGIGLSSDQVTAIMRGNAQSFFKEEDRRRSLDPTVDVGQVVLSSHQHPAPFRWTFQDPCQDPASAGGCISERSKVALPTVGWVSLSNYCNLSCLHCRRHYRKLGLKDHRRDIPELLYERLLSEVLPCLDSVILGGNNNSEVTQATRFEDIVRHFIQSSQRPRRISIQTNGSPIPSAILEHLIALNTVINISVEGGTDATTKAIRGIPLSVLAKQIEKINRARAGTQSEARVVLSFTATRSNIAELPDLVEFAERHGVDEVNLMHLLPATADWNDESLVHCMDYANRIIEETLSLCDAWRVFLMAPLIRDMNDKPCQRPSYSVSVDGEGDVRFCCLDGSPVIGNLQEAHLAEIWTGNIAEAARKSVNSSSPSGDCGACVLRNLPFVSAASLQRQLT